MAQCRQEDVTVEHRMFSDTNGKGRRLDDLESFSLLRVGCLAKCGMVWSAWSGVHPRIPTRISVINCGNDYKTDSSWVTLEQHALTCHEPVHCRPSLDVLNGQTFTLRFSPYSPYITINLWNHKG